MLHIAGFARREPLRFGKQASLPKLPQELRGLFQALPKTEQHLHLSGSVRRQDVATFMRENGLSPTQVKAELGHLKPHYDSLTDFLNAYYRVAGHVRTPSQFRRAALGIVKDAARENVRILELRSSVLNKGAPPEIIVEAIEAGLREGMAWVQRHHGYAMQTGLILLAQRAGSSEESLAHAQLAVARAKQPGSLVVGFDLAGDEIQHRIDKHHEALTYIGEHGPGAGVKLTIHAGEVPVSEGMSGLESLRKALAYHADRIGHGLQATADPMLKHRLIAQQIPVELSPWSNVQLRSVAGYAEHPIKTFLAEGLNVNLNTDNRLVNNITLTRQLGQLWQHGLVTTWDQLKKLTLNGIRGSFIPAAAKKAVEQAAQQELSQLEQRFHGTIARFLAPPPEMATPKAG